MPERSPDYNEGWREGYAQRMAEENADLKPRQTLLEGAQEHLSARGWRDLNTPLIFSRYTSAPEGESDPYRGPQTYDQAKDLFENVTKRLSDPSDYRNYCGDENCRAPMPCKEHGGGIVAAGAEEYDPDTASSRPEAPSLNRCWNRLDTQRTLIRSLFSLFNLAQSEARTERETNEATHRSLTERLDRLGERIDELDCLCDHRCGAVAAVQRGDVAALNERLDLIERILKSLPGVQEVSPGTWMIETKPR